MSSGRSLYVPRLLSQYWINGLLGLLSLLDFVLSCVCQLVLKNDDDDDDDWRIVHPLTTAWLVV